MCLQHIQLKTKTAADQIVYMAFSSSKKIQSSNYSYNSFAGNKKTMPLLISDYTTEYALFFSFRSISFAQNTYKSMPGLIIITTMLDL